MIKLIILNILNFFSFQKKIIKFLKKNKFQQKLFLILVPIMGKVYCFIVRILRLKAYIVLSQFTKILIN